MVLKRRLLFIVPALALLAALVPAPTAAAGSVTTVATGLDSPRGIAFFRDKLVVAEAGHGGGTCFGTPLPCAGGTSQISWIDTTNGAHEPLVSGLFSLNLGAEGVIGVSGLSATDGRLYAQIGTTPQELPPTLSLGQAEAGRLIAVHSNGTWDAVASVGATDFNFTLKFTEPTPGVFSPGTQEHDSNPYGVLAENGVVYVADAGSNTLDRVSGKGKIKILAYDGWRDPNPNNFPSDSVPTCVVRTGDGFLVGELSGRLLKVHGSKSEAITVEDSSGKSLLTHVTGCTSDGEGNVYFVNMFGAGAPFTPPPDSQFFIGDVVKYNVNSGEGAVLAGGLQFPNMATIGPDGNLYVTAGSICPSVGVDAPPCFGATGSVLKIAIPHGEGD